MRIVRLERWNIYVNYLRRPISIPALKKIALAATLILVCAVPANGFTLVGPSSWYGGPCDYYDNDIPRWKPNDRNRTPGIALYYTWPPLRLYLLKGANGRYTVVQHTDHGPHPQTGKLIDVNFTAAQGLGYSAPGGCVRGYPTGASVRITRLNWREASDWAVKTQTRLDNRWISQRRQRRLEQKRRPRTHFKSIVSAR